MVSKVTYYSVLLQVRVGTTVPVTMYVPGTTYRETSTEGATSAE